MINHPNLSAIHIRNINLWAHVGLLEKERLHGQRFMLDVSIWIDLDEAAKLDNLNSSVDYSIAIKAIQKASLQINCLTIEYFSERILEIIEDIYGPLPVKILLRKCTPPINGFTGYISIERNRFFDDLIE